ncbi:MAG TPA: hypothetical protein VFU82_07025, partial [Gammaproteobacteria bacterium]|nr:hypothetical protein [Gammaproteobacteria bacterium]
MINITRDDIQRLLNQYDKAKGWRKRHMPLVAEVDIIAKLRAFVKPLSGETGAELKAVGTQADSLSEEELYGLALMLLNRKKSTRAHKA